MDDSATLGEAKAWLRDRVNERPGKSTPCPCCKQKATVYHKPLHSTEARALITLYHHGGANEYVYCPDLPGDMHEISHAAQWGLVEDNGGRRADGGRAGSWKLTASGVAFVKGTLMIPKLVITYDNRVLGYLGDPISIHDALGKKFNYDEIMGNIATS